MEVVESFFGEQVKVLKNAIFNDFRGFFLEPYNLKTFQNIGIFNKFVQDGHSFSAKKGTIRGLHFQTTPMDQAKLVRVVKGAALDVIVDIRKNSPTFGKYESIELNESNALQVFIPKGFAHGFCTLVDDTHLIYKFDNYYSSECSSGIAWNDERIGVVWPTSSPILSEQDASFKGIEATIL